jgi:hypothetical protein
LRSPEGDYGWHWSPLGRRSILGRFDSNWATFAGF